MLLIHLDLTTIILSKNSLRLGTKTYVIGLGSYRQELAEGAFEPRQLGSRA